MDVVIPKIGLTVESVEVLVWHKAVGDAVTAGEVIAEVGADKADLEVEAPVSGTLTDIRFAVGDTAPVGEVVAVVLAPGETEAAAVPAPAPDGGGAAAVPDGGAVPAPATAPTSNGAGTRLRISPVARRFAAHHDLALAGLDGSGPRGRIVLRDVQDAVARGATAPETEPAAPAAPVAPPEPASPAGPAAAAPVRWTAARRATARLMAESAATVAPVTLHRRAAAEVAMATVKRLKAGGLPATFTHAIMHACAGALPAHPGMTSFWDGDRLMRSPAIHLGLAVDDGGDLLSAVVPDVAGRDATALVVGAVEAVARARAREAPAAAPTFAISNLGMFGVEQFTPIITPPQVAVLGVGAVVDGRCHLSLTFDHRAVDGAPAARFLADVCARLATYDGR